MLAWRHDGLDFFSERFLDFLIGDVLVETGLREVGRDFCCHRRTHVGCDQKVFQLLQGVIVQLALVKRAGQAGAKLG